MADIQSLSLVVITASTNYTGLNSISIINQSAIALIVTNTSSSGTINILQGETLMITANTGFVLPNINLNSSGAINASVITS